MNPAYERIYGAIKKIPRGRVATYGQIARLAKLPGRARLVGYALTILPKESGVPWHRVVNAKGEISARSRPYAVSEQRQLLERERIVFDAAGRLSLPRYRWQVEFSGAELLRK